MRETVHGGCVSWARQGRRIAPARALSCASAAFALLLALGAESARAGAQWTANGTPACQAPQTQTNGAIVSDGAGGSFLIWADGRNGSLQAYVQRISRAGRPAPGWPVNGVQADTRIGYHFFPRLVPDGQGGVIATWHSRPVGTNRLDVHVQRFDAFGAIAPGWPDTSVLIAIAEGGQASVTAVSDLAGGALLAWQAMEEGVLRVRVTRVLGNGTIDPAWPAGGANVSPTPGFQRLPRTCPDGSGGAIVVWQDRRNGNADIYAQRFLSNGTLAPGWPAEGIAVCSAVGEQLFATYAGVIPDGAGGAITVWEDVRDEGSDIYAQRIRGDGSIHPSWTPQGVPLCTYHGRQGVPVIASDGAGGGVVAWMDERNGDRDIYARRVLADGTVAWPADGLAVCDFELNGIAADANTPEIAGDGNGGAYIVWVDTRSGYYDVYGSHITAAGALAAGWTAQGTGMSTAPDHQFLPAITADGVGGAFTMWSDGRIATDLDIYMALVGDDGVVPAQGAARVRVATTQVSLEWSGPGIEGLARIERAAGDGAPWLDVGAPSEIAPDRVVYEDHDVTPGCRYGYRMVFESAQGTETSGETWVDVPRQAQIALGGFMAIGSGLAIAYSTSDLSPVTIEAFSIDGRRVFERSETPRAGDNLAPVDGGLPAGVYVLRLEQAGRSVSRKAIVLR